MNGQTYLGSCRTPSLKEMNVVEKCLEKGFEVRTEEYGKCLRSSGVEYNNWDELKDGNGT